MAIGASPMIFTVKAPVPPENLSHLNSSHKIAENNIRKRSQKEARAVALRPITLR